MKMHPQIISQKGHPIFVVLPYDEYEAILELLEDALDIAAINAAKDDNSECFPLDLVNRIAEGEHPIKVFREYRQLSQAELAKKVKISVQQLSQIETKERQANTALLKKIAKQLNLDVDDLE